MSGSPERAAPSLFLFALACACGPPARLRARFSAAGSRSTTRRKAQTTFARCARAVRLRCAALQHSVCRRSQASLLYDAASCSLQFLLPFKWLNTHIGGLGNAPGAEVPHEHFVAGMPEEEWEKRVEEGAKRHLRLLRQPNVDPADSLIRDTRPIWQQARSSGVARITSGRLIALYSCCTVAIPRITATHTTPSCCITRTRPTTSPSTEADKVISLEPSWRR
jgi:hypothetical protein